MKEKIKNYIAYRIGKAVIRREIRKGITEIAKMLPSITELLGVINADMDRLSALAAYLLSLSREDAEKVIMHAVVATNEDLDKEGDYGENV